MPPGHGRDPWEPWGGSKWSPRGEPHTPPRDQTYRRRGVSGSSPRAGNRPTVCQCEAAARDRRGPSSLCHTADMETGLGCATLFPG